MRGFVIGDKVRLNQPCDLTGDGMLILKKGVEGVIIDLQLFEEGLCAGIQLPSGAWWVLVKCLDLVEEAE